MSQGSRTATGIEMMRRQAWNGLPLQIITMQRQYDRMVSVQMEIIKGGFILRRGTLEDEYYWVEWLVNNPVKQPRWRL